MARGQHGDRPNFCTANVWLHGHLVTQLEKERKIANRYCQHGSTSMLLLILLGNITFQKFHVNSAKIWNGSM